MLVTSSTIVLKKPTEPLLQWPIFTRKSMAGFARKLTDFGMARRVNPADTLSETIISDSSLSPGLSGTPGYMAPEQTRGEPVSRLSDVFSLGLIVYEMMTGKPAISGKNLLEVLRKVERFEFPDDANSFPEPVKTLVQNALKTESSDRSSMREIVSLFN